MVFKPWVDRVNGYGVLFRFITPLLLSIILALGGFILNDIKDTQKESILHFTNHLSYHNQIESRLSRIETLIRKLK